MPSDETSQFLKWNPGIQGALHKCYGKLKFKRLSKDLTFWLWRRLGKLSHLGDSFSFLKFLSQRSKVILEPPDTSQVLVLCSTYCSSCKWAPRSTLWLLSNQDWKFSRKSHLGDSKPTFHLKSRPSFVCNSVTMKAIEIV